MLLSSPPLNKSVVKLIDDEEFDFDLPMTPVETNKRERKVEQASGKAVVEDDTVKEEDEEEDDNDIVFFGPVGHTEMCIAKAVEDEADEIVKPLSPLSAAQQVELLKESQILLFHLEKDRKSSSDSSNHSHSPSTQTKHNNTRNLSHEDTNFRKRNESSSSVSSASLSHTNLSCLLMNKYHEHGQGKRKLSDTSFASSNCFNESDVIENVSHLSSVHQTSHCSDTSSIVATSPAGSDVSSSSSKVMVNRTFTLGSLDKQLPDDLSVVLPKPKLSPDKHGVVKFGANVKPPSCGKTIESSNAGMFKQKNTFLKPPTRSCIPKISPPKRQRTIPSLSDDVVQAQAVSNNNRRSLQRPGSSTARRSLNNVPKKLCIKPPLKKSICSLNSTLPVLPGRNSNNFSPNESKLPTCGSGQSSSSSSTSTKSSGLKAPGYNKMLNSSMLVNPTLTVKQSGLKAPGASFKAPGSLNTTVSTSRPSGIKAPSAMPQLIKPGVLAQQRKTLAATRTKPLIPDESKVFIKPPGPVKAFAPLSKMAAKKDSMLPCNALVLGVSIQVMEATPTKAERKVQPKKIFTSQLGTQVASNNPSTPNRKTSLSSDSSVKPNPVTPTASAKRKSFLPTPKRMSHAGGIGQRKPQLVRADHLASESPAIGKLEIGSVVNEETPSCMLAKQPRVKHTPLGGKENEPKRSLWSPITRAKPITREEEMTKCTKRTALAYHN